MRKITALLILAALLLLPNLAGAQLVGEWYEENIAITATAATSDQTSAVIMKPQNAVGILTSLNVTVGAAILLDVNLQVYSPGADQANYYWDNAPSSEGITGVGVWRCVWGPYASAGDSYSSGIAVEGGFLPPYIKFLVDHGDATEVTYVLYYSWLF